MIGQETGLDHLETRDETEIDPDLEIETEEEEALPEIDIIKEEVHLIKIISNREETDLDHLLVMIKDHLQKETMPIMMTSTPKKKRN